MQSENVLLLLLQSVFQIINYGGPIIAKQPQETDQGNELSRRKMLTKNEPLFK